MGIFKFESWRLTLYCDDQNHALRKYNNAEFFAYGRFVHLSHERRKIDFGELENRRV